MILSGTQTAAARGQRLSELQALLPEVDFKAQESLAQVDLPAEGLRIPGFPKIIGPFGYTDVRASLSWSLVDVASLRNYLAAKHNFAAAQLSAQDARDLVVLTVGNAYLLAVADETEVSSVEAQVATAKVSLDQAVANHDAGTAPQLDELRAKVDYQTLEQQLIVARNALEKDKLALARTIGLPLEQKFALSGQGSVCGLRPDRCGRGDQGGACEPQGPCGAGGADQGCRRSAQGGDGRPVSDLHVQRGLRRYWRESGHFARNRGRVGNDQRSVVQGVCAARRGRERRRRNWTRCGRRASDKGAQVDADVRDALLDIQAAQKQVEVAQSSMALASEELKEAQERYANGVSDNLASEPGAAIGGAGQRPVCGEPLPAQHGQAQPGARAGRGRKLQEHIWEGSKRGGYESNTGPEANRLQRPRLCNRSRGAGAF